MRAVRALLLLLLPVVAVAHPGGGLIALDANTVIFGDSMYNAIWRLEQGKKAQALITKFHAHWTTRGLDGHIYSESFQEMGGAAFRIDLGGSKHVKVAEESQIKTLVFAVGKQGEFIFQAGTQLVERTLDGKVKPFRGLGEVAPGEPPLQEVIAYHWTTDGTLYLSDGSRLRRVGSDGVVRLVARVNGILIEPKIWNSTGAPRIWSIAVDESRERIYTALPDIGKVVRIDADGSQLVVDRSAGGWRVTAVATFADSVFMLESSDSTNDGQRVRVLRGSGKVELLGQVEPPEVAAQDKATANDSFDSFSIPPIPEVKISNGDVARFTNGDFVYPTFSPDGQRLAYSNVLVKRDTENTEVLLSDLRTGRQSVVLSQQRAKKYATYKVFVAEMHWKTANRLEVWLGDGDVGSAQLILNPFSRKLIQERFEDLDEELLQLTPDDQKTYQQAREIFPALNEEVLKYALVDPAALVIPEQGVVLQTNYTGDDRNVWFLDFKNKSAKPLLNVAADARDRFDGGIRFNSSVILVVSHNNKTRLFLYQDGKVRGLGEFRSQGYNRIEVKYVSPAKVIFLVRTHTPAEPGDNPLFVFDGSQLQRITDYPQLHDAAVDPAGKRIAYCYWIEDKRHIVVKDLN